MIKFKFKNLLYENILNEDKIGVNTYFRDSVTGKYYKYKKGLGFVEVDDPTKKGKNSKKNQDNKDNKEDSNSDNTKDVGKDSNNETKDKDSNTTQNSSSDGEAHKKLKANDVKDNFHEDVDLVKSEIEELNKKLLENGKEELRIDVDKEIKKKADSTSDAKDIADYLSKLYSIRDELISRCNQGGIDIFNDFNDDARQSQRDFTLKNNKESKNVEREFDKRRKDAKRVKKVKGTDIYVDTFGDLFKDSISKFAGRLKGGVTKVQSSTYSSKDAIRRSDKYDRPMTGTRTDIYQKHGVTELYVYVDGSGSWNKEKVSKALDMLGILNEYSDSNLPIGGSEQLTKNKKPTLKLRTRYTYGNKLSDEFPYVNGVNDGSGGSDFSIMALDIHKEKPKNLIIFTDSDSNACIDYTKDEGWFSYDISKYLQDNDSNSVKKVPPYETDGFVWLIFADTVAEKLVNVVHSTKKEKTMQVKISTSSDYIQEED